jgi:hypothetical protein
MSHDRHGKGILADWDSTDDQAAEAMGHAIADALRKHRQAGVPAAIYDWERGRVISVPPADMVIPEEGLNEQESKEAGAAATRREP